MDYKKICNDSLTQLSDELQENGLSTYETSSLMVDIYKVVKKKAFKGEMKNAPSNLHA